MAWIRPLWAGLALCVAAGAAIGQDAADRPVQLFEVVAGGDTITRQFFGVVAARQTVDLAFQVSGTLETFDAVEGEFIAQGDVVAELDLALFELALDQARVQADQAERALTRLQRLEGSAVSQVTVDDAETSAQLARLAVASAELDLQHATLRAPFTALVATRNVANFTTISAGTPVVRLHDMSDLRIEIDVPEVLFQQAGEDPDVTLYALFPAAPGQQFPVELREFNAEASAVGQAFTITLGMAPPPGLAVLPGATATIVATLRDEAGAMALPVSAVATDASGATYVMVFTETGEGRGTLARRDIALGAAPDGTPVVLSGLEPGEVVVRAGASALSDGQTVRRFDGFPN